MRAAAETQQQAAEARELELRSTLTAMEEQAQRLRSELATWEAAVAERDAELRNLQVSKNCNITYLCILYTTPSSATCRSAKIVILNIYVSYAYICILYMNIITFRQIIRVIGSPQYYDIL